MKVLNYLTAMKFSCSQKTTKIFRFIFYSLFLNFILFNPETISTIVLQQKGLPTLLLIKRIITNINYSKQIPTEQCNFPANNESSKSITRIFAEVKKRTGKSQFVQLSQNPGTLHLPQQIPYNYTIYYQCIEGSTKFFPMPINLFIYTPELVNPFWIRRKIAKSVRLFLTFRDLRNRHSRTSITSEPPRSKHLYKSPSFFPHPAALFSPPAAIMIIRRLGASRENKWDEKQKSACARIGPRRGRAEPRAYTKTGSADPQ